MKDSVKLDIFVAMLLSVNSPILIMACSGQFGVIDSTITSSTTSIIDAIEHDRHRPIQLINTQSLARFF